MARDPILSFLAQRSLFRDLPDSVLASLARTCAVVHHAPGRAIIRRGGAGDAMYIITEGAAEVSRRQAKVRQVVALLGPGDVFGEMALLTGEPRSADVTVTSDSPCVCLRFERSDIEALVRRQPLVARLLTAIVGQRLREPGSLSDVGKYQVLREIARGGAAVVYEGFHPGLRRAVAIKMLPHELVLEDDFLDRFQEEARLVAELQHENIVQVFDTENAYATCFIIMERLDGQVLKSLLAEGAASADETRHIVRQVARALAYAHRRGIIHSDVKPSNIFLEESGRAKLMDFGIAAPPRVVKDEPAAGILGTPGYIAPEMLLGGIVDGRADLYGLGVVAFEMLTGDRAFAGNDTVEILRQQMCTEALELPEDMANAHPVLAHVIARCTALEADDRYPDALSMLQDLGGRGSILTASAQGATLTAVYAQGDHNEVQAILRDAERRLNDIDGVRAARATFDL